MRRKDESRKVAIQEYIDKYFDEHSQVPSVRDIVAGTGIALATVHRYLVSMQESGELSYNGARNIGTSRIRKEAKMVSVPVLGRVSCGPGEWEEEDIIEYIRLPESFVGKGQFFILIAKGESMIDADVHPGDYVVVRQQQTANDGDLVVALYDEQRVHRPQYAQGFESDARAASLLAMSGLQEGPRRVRYAARQKLHAGV